jgi:membrane protein
VKEVKDDSVPLLSGGVTYYAMLALFPSLIALVSIYGLVASPSDVDTQLASLTRAMPEEARNLIITQLTAVTQKSSTGLGIGAVVSIIVALWSASSGMRWLLVALSRAYDADDTRKFVRMRGTALALTVAAIIGGVVVVATLVALPSIYRILGLGSNARFLISLLRWPVLAVLLMLCLAVLYRYGPDRDPPPWRWVLPGSIAATILWILASAGFTIYTSTLGRFDKTYGALGAIIVLMLWLFLGAFAVLLGAEINSEIELEVPAAN